MHERGARARVAARRIARADTGTKNAALFALAQAILDDSDAILQANAQDMRGGRNAKPDAALLQRLELNPRRVEAMADGLRPVAQLPDPVGELPAPQSGDGGPRKERVRTGKSRWLRDN